MAYTPGLGRTPEIVATRLISSTVAAAATFALAQWWPLAAAPGEGVVFTLIGIGFVSLLLGIALPLLAESRPIRVVALDDGVAIPARRVTMSHVLYPLMFSWGLAGVFAAAGGLEGPRESPTATWAAISAILAFALVYILVQRPWKRRIELRRDSVRLCAGEEDAYIPWDDVTAIVQAPLVSHARSGLKHMREYNAAAIAVIRHSDTEQRRNRRLEDHYPTGDLACQFQPLLLTLQYLHANPQERQILADPERVSALLNAWTPADH